MKQCSVKTNIFFPLLTFFLTSAVTVRAQEVKSGLFFEPSLTYEYSDTSVNYPSPFANSTGKSDGFGLGARFGFHLQEIFFLGVDGRYSMPKFKDSSVNYDASATSNNWGAVIGMQMLDIGLRVWGSYLFAGELNPEKSGSFDVNFKDLKGYRIGAGFRIQELSLNLEYQDVKYGKTSLEQIGPFSTNTVFDSVNLQNKTWIASLSFPFEF